MNHGGRVTLGRNWILGLPEALTSNWWNCQGNITSTWWFVLADVTLVKSGGHISLALQERLNKYLLFLKFWNKVNCRKKNQPHCDFYSNFKI